MKTIKPLSTSFVDSDRRAFLKLSGLLGLGLATSTVIPCTAEAVSFNREFQKVSRTKLAMGTVVSMTLIHPSQDQAEEAIGRAFEEIDRLSALMNRFDNGSAITCLNRDAYLNDLSFEVAEVISRGLYYYKLSGGIFDISVKPIIDLFNKELTDKKKIIPADLKISPILKLIGSDKIELKGRSIRFKRPGMGITLDGIAKGYIVDCASEILSSYKIKNHLINAGGDIRTSGKNISKKPWTIAIQDPQKNRQYPCIITLTNGAIATSGNYEIYFDREKMFHHIINPKNGLSPDLNISVSVIAKSAMDADALSTSVFVMPSLQGAKFIDSIPGCGSLVMTKKGRLFQSNGWNKLTA